LNLKYRIKIALVHGGGDAEQTDLRYSILSVFATLGVLHNHEIGCEDYHQV